MRSVSFILILTFAMMMLACEDDGVNYTVFPPGGTDCVDGSGSIASESRTMADFHSISSMIYADVFITSGPKEDIIIEAQQNILGLIITEVVNEELRITLDQCVRIADAVKVHVTIPDVRSLSLTGVGEFLTLNDLDQSELNISLIGTGNFDLQGTVDDLDILLTGVGDVNAFKLSSDICDVTITGVGDAEVFVNNELDVTISGTGTVRYKGNPSITTNITGIGSLVDAN